MDVFREKRYTRENMAKIEAAAAEAGVSLDGFQIIETEHSHAAAEKAVGMAVSGEVAVLVKGSLHTDELLGAVVACSGPETPSSTISQLNDSGA